MKKLNIDDHTLIVFQKEPWLDEEEYAYMGNQFLASWDLCVMMEVQKQKDENEKLAELLYENKDSDKEDEIPEVPTSYLKQAAYIIFGSLFLVFGLLVTAISPPKSA